MDVFTKEEFSEALRAVNSLLSKCQKAQEKLSHRPSQFALLKNRIKALKISSYLIKKNLEDIS